MKIVIPMAGHGKRLRPHTWSRPKPLISVAGKPILAHVLDMFADLSSIDEVVMIVGPMGEQVQDYMRQAYPQWQTRYAQQLEMRGQSHAIWQARQGLAGPMAMVFVDTLIEADLSVLKVANAPATAWVKEVEDPRRFGVAEVGEDGWVTRLVEKPRDSSNNLAVVGFYYFPQAEDLLSAIEQQMESDQQLHGEYYLVDAINIMIDNGLKMRVQKVDIWQDCGTPDALLQTNRYLLDHGRDNSSLAATREGIVIVPPVFIHPSATIRHSVIGPHASIGASCTVDRSLIWDSIVEEGAEIVASALTASLIGRGAHVTGQGKSLNIGDATTVRLG